MYKRNRMAMVLGLGLVLSACSDKEQEPLAAGRLTFAASLEAMSETRAGEIGEMSLDRMKDYDLITKAGGFGVFGYYTGQDEWSAAKGNAMPDFMYNQQVYWDETSWTYEPLKYWPNESGSHLSFFAYAPYVDPKDGLGTYGITAVSTNTDKGAPKLTYVLSAEPLEQVDLLWGTRGKDIYQEDEVTSVTKLTPPYLNTDLTRQAVNERVSFLFKHAMARVDVYVRRIYDEKEATGKKPDSEDYTKIFVSKLSLDYAGGQIYTGGTFDLEKGWSNGTETFGAGAITISSGDINADLQGTTEPNSRLTPVQNVELNRFDYKTGVDEQLRCLTDLPYAYMLIPCQNNTGLSVTPTITYSFVTQDPSLVLDMPNSDGSAHYARIQHTITGEEVHIGTQYEDDGGEKKYRLEAGKRYIFLCNIGVESVQFQVVGIEDWDFPLRFTTDIEEAFKPVDYKKDEQSPDAWQSKTVNEE